MPEARVEDALVRRAIEAPLRQLADNAGQEGALIVPEVKKRKNSEGYNVATGEYVDLVKAGGGNPCDDAKSYQEKGVAKEISKAQSL